MLSPRSRYLQHVALYCLNPVPLGCMVQVSTGLGSWCVSTIARGAADD